MKRYGNLYPKIYDVENTTKAILKASKGKRHRRDVKYILNHIDRYAARLSDMLKNHTYTPTPYTEGTVVGGTNNKERKIHKPSFYPDQCVQWAICLQISPILNSYFYEYSCGSVPGRGAHYGKQAIEKWVRNDRKHTKYYLKMDVHKFYPSVKTEHIKAALRRKFKDPELLQLLDLILNMHTGLPIGILLSQWLANLFLTPLDFKIKQELKAPYYMRYMDDMVVFGNNKRELHKMRIEIEKWLNENGLQLKGNWQVCRFDKEPLDFMGFRFYRNHTTIRKSILYRITRRIRRVKKHGVTYHRAAGIISSLGYIHHTDSHKLYLERIKPFINIKQLKTVIRSGTTNGNIEKRKHNKPT